MKAVEGEPFKVLYALGPGDVVQSFRSWSLGGELASETSQTFSGQFFSLCREEGMQAWAISTHPRAERLECGAFRVENRPKPGPAEAGGIRYHVKQLAYALSLLRSALAYRPSIAVFDSGTTHWFLLAIFRMAGIPVACNFHNTCWPSGFPPASRVARAILKLDGWFLRFCALFAAGVSPECQRQARALAGSALHFLQYRAQYSRTQFPTPAAPDHSRRPFRVMFAGRVERNKGVFDILDMAEILARRRPGEFAFDIYGDGSALEGVRESILRRGLQENVAVHGKLTRPDLFDAYQRCHLVVVPTRSDFTEGLAMVAAEAVLMGRPVLASRVVPACEVLGASAIVARTNDAADYARRIEGLLDDPASYARAVAACAGASAQFTDPGQGMAEAFRRGFALLGSRTLLMRSAA